MKENAVKLTTTHKAHDRLGNVKKPPGRIVGVIERLPENHPAGTFNPLILYFTVSPFRKDYNQVVDQLKTIKNTRLPKYEASLFHSCFKKW
ncbi:hypothetical protein [Neobacillus sp. NPDC093127]|uniref:hypothetical protein n=1 Tax=Neobacillus sp. NPDC093127 TaxID=3364296 RepID=UPI0038257895